MLLLCSLLVATETLLNFDLLKTQISAETLSAYLVQQAKSLVFVIGDFYQFNKNIIISVNFTRIDFMLGKMQITLIVLNF
jgi:hypothetical protein